jgi:hypothetical protein
VLEDIARSFHFKNLNRAVEQFAMGENVIPVISYLKDGEAVNLVRVKGGPIQAALRIIQEKFEPDAINVVLLPSSPVPFSPAGGAPSVLKRILFAMTFDHLGNRWVSLFEVRKEGNSVELKDLGPKDLGRKAVSIETLPDGDLEIRINSMRPRNRT